jgi:capsular polysaccharide biosynthesis protein
LLQPSSHAYFHFMFETLPRLQLSLQWMKRHKNCSILVDAWHGNTWSAQALDLMGFRGSVVARRAQVRYSVGVGFIPPAPPMHHTYAAELAATVGQLLAAAGADGAGWNWRSGSVLFIQRASGESQHSAIHSDDCPKGVRMREILNMDEVEQELRSRFGTRLLIFRSHGVHLAQQIKAFRNASMVIGVHGI